MRKPLILLWLLVTLMLSGCASTDYTHNLLYNTVIVTNSIRNAQQITEQGLAEELRNHTNRMLPK